MASPALVRGSRMVYQGNEVSVQWVGVSLATVADEQEKSFTVPISRLKPIKRSKMNAEIAAVILPFVRSLAIGGNPNVADRTIQFISENSSLSETEAADYFRPTTDRSHNAKFDVEAPNAPAELIEKLGVPLDSRPFAQYILRAGILPKKVTL